MAARLVKVRMTRLAASPAGTWPPGSVIEVTRDAAIALIDSGSANLEPGESIEPDETEDTDETSQVDETATAGKKRGRKNG